MKAAVLYKPGLLKVEDVEIPQIEQNEVLIRVKYCGICGTDPHIYKGEFPLPSYPIILGHEFSGEIVKVGDKVERLKKGNRITADINIGCETCYFCRRNQKLLCPNIRQIGVHIGGAFAEYLKAPEKQVYQLPNKMSFEHGAFIEPLACVIHAFEISKIEVGDSVVILGAGPMGLLHLQVAKLLGAYPVVISDLVNFRLEKAKNLEADLVIDVNKTDVTKKVMNLTDKRGADLVIVAAGSIPAYRQAFEIARRGGTIIAFGAAPTDAIMEIKPFDVYSRELRILGSYAGTYDTWPKAITLIETQKIKVDPLITHKIPLNRIVDGMNMILKKQEEAVKILVSPDIEKIERITR